MDSGIVVQFYELNIGPVGKQVVRLTVVSLLVNTGVPGLEGALMRVMISMTGSILQLLQ